MSVAVSSNTRESTLAKLADLSASGLGAQEFLEEAGAAIERAVPSHTFFYAAADPDSGLAMGAGTTTLPHEVCAPFWDYEFFVPDFSKWTDLATGPRNVSDLHTATGGRPERSARWREFGELIGVDAELRATVTEAGTTWGMVQLNRTAGSPPFGEDEVELIEALVPHLARGLRSALTGEAAVTYADRGPGMAILDRDGNLVSLTGEAEAWLGELATTFLGERGRGDELPYEIAALASSARRRHEAGEAPPRMRMRSAAGIWLLAHASALGGSDQVALVIEPAKASEVAPLIVEAYGLTPRELEVTRMISRGLKTAEMADRLFLSPHTVRDHVKAIFEKVGVSSRGELTATLFAEHYHDTLREPILTAEARRG
jgi:DNA-binding CsgD family transcriptional regulator/GAF domain-containing protein